jgi:hypothetical protein
VEIVEGFGDVRHDMKSYRHLSILTDKLGHVQFPLAEGKSSQYALMTALKG